MLNVLRCCALVLLLSILTHVPRVHAAEAPRQTWSAIWISHPTAPLRDPLVLHFRKEIRLDAQPQHYIVHVSGDRRFTFYVNGQRVGTGPASSDLPHWRYQTFDIGPALHPGANLLTATVWNFGVYAAISQLSDRTAFLVQGDTAQQAEADTNDSWSVAVEPGIAVLPPANDGRDDYMAVGGGETLLADRFGWAWQQPGDRTLDWQPARPAMREDPDPKEGQGASEDSVSNIPWRLAPDPLPAMTYVPTAAGALVRAEPALTPASTFPERALTIPAHTHAQLILDHKTLTTAYPALGFSAGRGARIVMTYAEALYDEHLKKGNRDAVEGRHAIGVHDQVMPDGSANRVFEPMWWRTWRYLQLDIETNDQPLTLNSLTAHESTYPFEQRARFESTDASLAKIWEIGWRTARLDAHETYMDTPYFERLQYVGDTRIQALISYAVAGDDRLARQAIQAFANSRLPSGLTQSRYPSSVVQIIPPFSLYWIGMLRDLYWYRPDPQLVKDNLQGTRDVLAWFFTHQGADGLVQRPPYWNFVDWVPEGQTIPTYDAQGDSCVLSLELAGALADAAELESALGSSAVSADYRERLDHLRTTTTRRCWSPERRLMADTPDRTSFSEQANILGVLYDATPQADQQDVLRRIVGGKEKLMPASYYFRFYLARALEHAGLAELYLDSLEPWQALLPMGFSTWPEMPGDTRSDSHAWSAHPTYDLLTMVGGIRPGAAGFGTVRIAPALGKLTTLTVHYPHPKGEIVAHYERHDRQLQAEITLPPGLTGSFAWGGTTRELHPGMNRLSLNASGAEASAAREGARRPN